LPTQVVSICELLETDRAFHEALIGIGMHFAEDELAPDLLDDLKDTHPELERFLPLWGNGYGDTMGGISLDGAPGAIVILHIPECDMTTAGIDLASAIRHQAAQLEELGATRAFLESVLARFEVS
jgi:hypothetical protein